jgi:hypothetical protein
MITLHFTYAWSDTYRLEVDEVRRVNVELGDIMNNGKFNFDRTLIFGSTE